MLNWISATLEGSKVGSGLQDTVLSDHDGFGIETLYWIRISLARGGARHAISDQKTYGAVLMVKVLYWW